MTIAELIETLRTMPQDAEVKELGDDGHPYPIAMITLDNIIGAVLFEFDEESA